MKSDREGQNDIMKCNFRVTAVFLKMKEVRAIGEEIRNDLCVLFLLV